jgi:hypothetical protein
MRSRPRLTYANIVSTLALVIAMSTGGAYAASLVRTSDIADGAVNNPKLRDDAVGRAKLRDDAVGQAQLGSGAVTTSKISSAAVTAAKVAGNAITSAKVANETLTTDDVADATLLGNDLQDNSIGAQKLQLGAFAPSAFARVHGSVPTESFAGSPNLSPSTMITHHETGVDCWHDLPFQPRTISVSSWISYSGPALVSANLGASTPCPEDTQISVFRYYPANMSAYDGSYFIQIWQ